MATGIIVKIKGDVSQLKQSLAQAKTETKSFFESQKGFSALSVAGYASATTAAVGLGGAIFSLASEFSTAKSTIARATGATGDELETLYGTFKDTLANVPDDMATVAAVVGDAATRFADASQEALRDVSHTALDFARIAGGDPLIVIQSLGQAANAMGLNAKEASDALDVWTGVAIETGISGNDLATTLAKNATLFDTLGVDAEEAAVLIGEFHRVGVKTREVGTVLANLATKAAESGTTMEGALRRVQQELQNAKTDTDAVEIAVGYFGETSGPTLAIQLRESKIAVDDLAAAVLALGVNTTEVADETADMTSKWSEVWNRTKTEWEPSVDLLSSTLLWLYNRMGDLNNRIYNETEPAIDSLADTSAESATMHVENWNNALDTWSDNTSIAAGTVVGELRHVSDNASEVAVAFVDNWNNALEVWKDNTAIGGAAVREELQHVADTTTAVVGHQLKLFQQRDKYKERQSLILEDSSEGLVGFTEDPFILARYTAPERQEIAPHIKDLVLQTLAIDTTTGTTVITGGTGGTGTTTTTDDEEETEEERKEREAREAAAAAAAAERHQQAIERLLDANDDLSERYAEQIDALAKKIELDELAEELDLEDPTGMRAAGIEARKDLLDYLETSVSSLDDAAKDWADLTAEELESGIADLESYRTEFDIFRDQLRDLVNEERHAAGLQRLRDSVPEEEDDDDDDDDTTTTTTTVTTGSGTTTSGDVKIILEAAGRSLQEWQVAREDLDGTHRVLRAREGQVMTRPVGACG